MAFLALTDATLWANQYDLTCQTNRVEVSTTVNALDATTFCSGGNREVVAGLRDTSLSFNAYSDDQAAVDAALDGLVGVAGSIMSIATTTTTGSVGYFAKRLLTEYGQPVQVGELVNLAGTALGSSKEGLVRGQLLLPKQTVTGNVTGTGQQLGDIAAGENLYAAIHCFTAGTSASVIIESDDNSGFTTPTTRSTTVVTTVGATWVQVDPTVTGTWWRVRVGSVTGTFSLAALVGIQ